MRPLSIRARLTIWYAAALLAILAVVSALSYSVLRWSLLQQVDASLATVAQIVRETDERGAGGSEVERAIRELLGPGFSDQFFQFLDPEGRSRFRSGPPPVAAVPLSPEARTSESSSIGKCFFGARKRFCTLAMASNLLRLSAGLRGPRCPSCSAFPQSGFLKQLHRRRPGRHQASRRRP